MTRTRYKIYETCYPYFLTCTVVGWTPVFTRPETVEVVLNSWRFLQERKRLTIFGYVILENHLHMIASSSELSKEIGDFKSFTAREIIDLLRTRNVRTLLQNLRNYKAAHKTGQGFQFWQEGSHPQQIQYEEMMRQKLEYIHDNPVKRGYVGDPTHWRYSSARDYAGMPGLIEVATDWA